MPRKVDIGDKVTWQTSQGPTTGTVREKLTTPVSIKRHRVAASDQKPEYLVESEKSGKKAAHKAAALKPVKPK